MNKTMIVEDSIQSLSMFIATDYYQSKYEVLEKTLQEKGLKYMYVLILNAFLSLLLRGNLTEVEDIDVTPYASIAELYGVLQKWGYDKSMKTFTENLAELTRLGLLESDKDKGCCRAPLNDYQVFSKAVQIIQNDK